VKQQSYYCEGITANLLAPGACGLSQSLPGTHMSPRTRGWETLCYNMLCKKQSAIIIMNIKQTNLLLKNWLWLHSGSGPSLEKSTPAPLLFSKIVKTPARGYSDTPAPSHTPLAVSSNYCESRGAKLRSRTRAAWSKIWSAQTFFACYILYIWML